VGGVDAGRPREEGSGAPEGWPAISKFKARVRAFDDQELCIPFI